MKIDYQSYTTEHLNQVLTSAMAATVNALVTEGLLADETAAPWVTSHACVQATKGGFLQRWLTKFWPNLGDDQAAIVVVKVVHNDGEST